MSDSSDEKNLQGLVGIVPRDSEALEAAHTRSGDLVLEDFEPLVGECFSIIQTLDNQDAGGVQASLVEAGVARQEPFDEASRQPFRLQFELPPECTFGQNTFLMSHQSTGEFWAMLVPVSQTEKAFSMCTLFS